MCNTIFEYSKFHKLETCLPQYMDLVNAVEQNYNMDLLNLFESDLSEGLYIHVKLHISIPTNGVYEELDVHSEEEIVIYAKTDYPFSAPAVLFVRNDFPSNRIPHLNLGVSDSSISLLNPCLYRGNIDEWFYQNGPEKFCDRINGWFSDLVNGELINEDGFETVRDLINKYQNTENGIICINIFDKNNMTNNRLLIYEIEPMEIFQKVDGWSIHINRSIYQRVQQYSNETQENAGLWIGHIEERIKRITIVDTFIPDDNVRKNASVTMGNKEVNTYLKTLAVKTNGLIKYIGEWHTHTSGDASPSQQDIKTFEETKVNISAFLMTIVSPSNTCNYIIKGKHNG